jgi:enoyl-CoA hydratase/carnithine racemase
LSQQVHVEDIGRVRVITLARADRKNALNQAMYRALTDALRGATEADAVRAALIQADGDTFCGGNDMADFLAGGEGMAAVLAFLEALLAFPKPLLAAVQGGAVGIGTTLLLHCDLAWASPAAWFKTPFAQLALVPEAGSSLTLPALVGHRRAFQWLVLGDVISAQEAAEAGLVNAVVPPESLRAHALAEATRLAALPPAAVRASRQLLRAPMLPALREVMAIEARTFRERLESDEAKEAVTAFLQKRKPDFDRFV